MRPFDRYCQGKRTLATLASLPRPRGRGKASVASAFARRSGTSFPSRHYDVT
jgi:hypothetical protein